jgi:hypothetical protein
MGTHVSGLPNTAGNRGPMGRRHDFGVAAPADMAPLLRSRPSPISTDPLFSTFSAPFSDYGSHRSLNDLVLVKEFIL